MSFTNDKLLFVCETNAQLLNAINLKLNVFLENDADLCLCDNSVNSMGDLMPQLENSKVFTNVFVYHTGHDTNQSIFGKIKRALRSISLVNDIADALQNRNTRYSMVFISGPSSSVNGVYYHFKNVNPNIRLFLYEEGIFEYYMLNSKNVFRRIYSKTIFGTYYLDEAEGVYVYCPELLTGKLGNKKILEIPSIKFNDYTLLEVVNSIFEVQAETLEHLKNVKYLYMDQAFPSEEENLQQYHIIRKIAEEVGRDRMLIKMHPNSSFDKYKEFSDLCIKTNIAMEVIELNLELRDVTLLTICSSSVFNFKLIFDVHPQIILLYKMFKGVTIDKNLYKFVDAFKDYYFEGEVIAPADIKEIGELL